MTEMRGRGAWSLRGKDNGSPYYCFKTLGTMDGAKPALDFDHLAVHYGVKAIQSRLGDLGYRHLILGAVPVTGNFGPRTQWGVQWFQKQNGLKVDGVFGRVTAKAFFGPLIRTIGTEVVGRYAHVLYGISYVESGGLDPGAVSGVYQSENGPDVGIAQINRRWNPYVTIEQAFLPNYALRWSANRFAVALDLFKSKPALQGTCAIANHNSSVQAREWFRTGEAPSEQIADYVAAVKANSVFPNGI